MGESVVPQQVDRNDPRFISRVPCDCLQALSFSWDSDCPRVAEGRLLKKYIL